MTRLLVQIDRAVDCFQLLGCLCNLVEMSSCISSVQNWVVQLLNRLCSLLYLAEAVVGIVVQVDRAVDLLQTLEMLLNHIKAVLSTLRQIHRTRDGSKTLSRTQFMSKSALSLCGCEYSREKLVETLFGYSQGKQLRCAG